MVASRTPPTGDLAHKPGVCPHWESNQQPFGSQACAESTELCQPGLLHHSFMLLLSYNISLLYFIEKIFWKDEISSPLFLLSRQYCTFKTVIFPLLIKCKLFLVEVMYNLKAPSSVIIFFLMVNSVFRNKILDG